MNRVVSRGGLRLDKLVSEATGCGRRKAARWIAAGLVRVDGHPAPAASVPLPGQIVDLAEGRVPEPRPAPTEPVRLLLRRGDLVAISKPAGLHTQHGRSGGSVADFLEQSFAEIAQVGNRLEEAGTVHRLDRDTSGVLLAAITRAEYLRVRGLFSSGRVAKEYLALTAGEVGGEMTIERPLAARTARVVEAGRRDRRLAARTLVQPLETGAGWSLVHVRMSTGVRHQVRAHLALEGHPLLGDATYGGPAAPTRGGQLLHALRITLDGELDVTAPPAADFVAALAALRVSGVAGRPSGERS